MVLSRDTNVAAAGTMAGVTRSQRFRHFHRQGTRRYRNCAWRGGSAGVAQWRCRIEKSLLSSHLAARKWVSWRPSSKLRWATMNVG